MDASSSYSFDANPTTLGASKYLDNLPSRGHFTSTIVSSNPGRMRVYICVHDTSPPDDQEIKTNQQNILIRSLMLRNNSSRDVKGVAATEPSRKRVGERVSDNRAKRANVQSSSTQEGSSSKLSNQDFQSLTVEKLRALLKQKGLSPKGRKDELIARLKNVNG